MPNFLYPRTIAIRRPYADVAVGEQSGYGGVLPTNETALIAGVAAHIQVDKISNRPPGAGLPADSVGEPMWKIIFRATAGLVKDHDIIVDDLGNRFQVITAAWQPLGYTCRCTKLEN